MISEIVKTRSLSSCIKLSYTLFTSNLKTIFHCTWIWLLLYSIASAVLSYQMTQYAINTQTSTFTTIRFVVILACVLVMVGAYIELLTRFYEKINQLPRKNNRKRIAGSIIAGALIFFTFSIIICISCNFLLINRQQGTFDIQSAITALSVSMFLILLMTCILCPLTYAFNKYIFNLKQRLWADLFRNLKIGMRYWGLIFTTNIVTLLIIAIVFIVVSIPSMILFYSIIVSTSGVLNGDPSGLPSTFPVLFITINTLTTFIYLFVSLWHLTVNCYLYGSITSQEKSKENY